MIEFDNIEEACKYYISVLDRPPNGWGQYCCPQTGVQSHVVLKWCYDQFGYNNCAPILRRLIKET